MTRPNITPGEWNFTKGVIPAINGSIRGHAVTVAKTIYGSHDEALANARAIAALPQLLEALESFANTCEHGNPMQFVQKIGADCIKAKAALALAGYTF